MTLNQWRTVLYRTARTLGDVNAVTKRKVPRRIGRRLAGKVTGRLMARVFG